MIALDGAHVVFMVIGQNLIKLTLMKKIIITFVIILPLIIFNKNIISQLIIFTTSKLTDRNISIETIDIDYLKKKIILNSVKVESTKKIYDDLYKANEEFRTTSRTKLARSLKQKNDSPRSGTHRVVVKKYLEKLGWQWTPTMFIGQGCKVHLKKDELPSGTLIVSCSKHITVVKDGVLHDTYDCSRRGTRCVYGYWTKPN